MSEITILREQVQHLLAVESEHDDTLNAVLFCLARQGKSTENLPGLHRCPNALRHGVLYYYWLPFPADNDDDLPDTCASFAVKQPSGWGMLLQKGGGWRCLLMEDKDFLVDFSACPYCGEQFIDLIQPLVEPFAEEESGDACSE